MGNHQNRYYEFDEFRLDAHKRVLLKNGDPVHLTHKVFEVLLVLLQNRGRVLDKDELLNLVWEDTIVEEANLKNSISMLRKALGDERGASRYIQTLPKRGYKFIAPVVALPDENETYLVEKLTTTEIVIDEVIEGHRLAENLALPKAMTGIVEASDDSRANAPAATLPADNDSTHASSLLAWIMQRKKSLAIAILLLALGGVASIQWFAPDRSKFNFERMRVTKLSKPGKSPAFLSPDGKYLAYLSDVGLWVKPVNEDSELQLLPTLPDNFWGLAFSKDSSQIYLTVGGSNYPNGALFQIALLGGTPKKILEGIGSSAVFSPDGQRIAFYGPKGLISTNLDGSNEQIILFKEGKYLYPSYSWSPDGKRFALAVLNASDQSTWQVIEVPAEGGEERPIGKPLTLRYLSTVWFPDGKGLLVTGMDGTTGFRQLWYLSYPEGELQRITSDSNDYWYASVSADGNSIFAYYPQESSDIWLAEAASLEQAKKITTRSGIFEDARWTPDSRILFTANEGGLWGKRDVWIMNADGSHQQRLTNAGSNRTPAMSPDSRLIAFRSIRDKDIRQLWVMEANGRNARQIITGQESKFPRFTPDGKAILFVGVVTGQSENLYKIPVAGGEPVPITNDKVISSWAISPDGKQVAYSFFNKQKKRPVIGVKSIEGGASEQIYDYFPDLQFGRNQHWTRGDFFIQQWTKDGFLCIGKEIYLLPLDGKKPRQLSHFNSSDTLYACEISPDGKRMVFSRGASTFNTVLFTNFR